MCKADFMFLFHVLSAGKSHLWAKFRHQVKLCEIAYIQ